MSRWITFYLTTEEIIFLKRLALTWYMYMYVNNCQYCFIKSFKFTLLRCFKNNRHCFRLHPGINSVKIFKTKRLHDHARYKLSFNRLLNHGGLSILNFFFAGGGGGGVKLIFLIQARSRTLPEWQLTVHKLFNTIDL